MGILHARYIIVLPGITEYGGPEACYLVIHLSYEPNISILTIQSLHDKDTLTLQPCWDTSLGGRCHVKPFIIVVLQYLRLQKKTLMNFQWRNFQKFFGICFNKIFSPFVKRKKLKMFVIKLNKNN